VTENRTAYTAVVLVGGRAERLGGADKTRLEVGDRPILMRVLDAVADADRVVVVGRRDASDADSDRVRWVCEEPPGGGPVAGLAAAMIEIETDVLVLLAGDLPFVEDVPGVLLTALADTPGADAIVPVDRHAHRQPLTAAYRTQPVRDGLARSGDPHGLAMRTLLDRLNVTTLGPESFGVDVFDDVDTMEDLTAARHRAGTPPDPDPHR
jgi:molybdopterin-guanine dinucleotide biosynthesis protein A